MKIDKNLNIVVGIGREGEEIYFHSTPISSDVFRKYHFVICKTFTELLTAGLELTGAKIAAMQLEDVAVGLGKWEGAAGVKNGLLAEIARLTNVIVLSENGWEPLPVNIAIQRKLIDEDDWEEAKQRIVFFTLVCAMTTREVRDDLLSIMNSSWGTQNVSSTCTEFAASLPTSTETEISPKKTNQSSVPV